VIHPTAEIERGARIGRNSRIWHFVHIRTGAVIGSDCNLGHSVFVDSGVVIGNNVKLQNRVSIYRGVTLEDGVFIGPHVSFTNDRYPRAITPQGLPISDEDWTPEPTLVRHGASIGAGSMVLSGLTIGRWALVGAGAVVTRDVPDHGLMAGNPARLVGYACRCGRRLTRGDEGWTCSTCNQSYDLPALLDEGAA
jgi:acetyltransferase-like isoleucine patch superfamily enzyme